MIDADGLRYFHFALVGGSPTVMYCDEAYHLDLTKPFTRDAAADVTLGSFG